MIGLVIEEKGKVNFLVQQGLNRYKCSNFADNGLNIFMTYKHQKSEKLAIHECFVTMVTQLRQPAP